MPWQQDYIWRLYGWVHRDTGLRRFDRAYLEVAKKNGKSPLVAAQSLYHLVGDGEPGPEVYINACSREQAGIIYRSAAAMVRQDPELAAMIDPIPSAKRLVLREGDGFLVANSFEADNKDGVESSFTIFDELHRQPNDDLWDVFQYAGDSRLQPLLVSITTAGSDQRSVCYRQHQKALAVEAGSDLDVGFLGIVYGPRVKPGGPPPDVDDRRVWRMANPSMGVTIDEEKFAAQLETAKKSPAALANFKRLKLNIWTKEDEKFVDMARWHAQPARRTLEAIEESGDVWCAGLDMAIKTDLNAYVRIAGDIRTGIDVFTKVWIPEDTVVRRSKEEGLPYQQLADDGWVEVVPGSVMDPSIVEEFIEREHERFGLKYVLSDFVNTGAMAPSLVKKGVPFLHLKPGSMHHTFPTKTLEALILQNLVRHGDNPMLAYCAGNACVDVDPKTDNVMLVKGKSTGRIDAMIALVSAIAGLLRATGVTGEGGDEATKRKPFKNHDLVWVDL